MISVTLNRRHKAGLFLVLVATGLSLFFEASAKQTVGIVLLGVAATWLFGSASLRVLGFGFSSLACVVGLSMAILPILNERDSYLVASAEYDLALAEIRSAVARAPAWDVVSPPVGKQVQGLPPGAIIKPIPCRVLPRPPKGFVLDKMTPAQFAAWVKREYPEYMDMDDAQLVRRVVSKYPECKGVMEAEKTYLDAQGNPIPPPPILPADFFDRQNAPTPKREVHIPEVAQKWLRPDWWSDHRDLGGKLVMIPFPADATDDAIMAEFQAKRLVPRPTFSIAAAIRSHRAPFSGGVVLIAVGILGFAGVLWWKPMAKETATVSPS